MGATLFYLAFYLVMNVAVGGNFPGAPNDATRFPAELQSKQGKLGDP